ncbi:hypothetical protein [Mycolicibacterium goodii]|uniref:hypothetical protein n=1 Tax=Mycolicibacterium goodii TaxID=134601 RepID=UPI0012FFBFC1
MGISQPMPVASSWMSASGFRGPGCGSAAQALAPAQQPEDVESGVQEFVAEQPVTPEPVE